MLGPRSGPYIAASPLMVGTIKALRALVVPAIKRNQKVPPPRAPSRGRGVQSINNLVTLLVLNTHLMVAVSTHREEEAAHRIRIR